LPQTKSEFVTKHDLIWLLYAIVSVERDTAGRSEDQTMQYVDKWFELIPFVLGPNPFQLQLKGETYSLQLIDGGSP
jgi:hypothetical protein